jgi:elongation factor G
VVGVEVELYDGKFHAVDSDEASFKAAGARAFREAFKAGSPVLLEPLMSLELHVPTESTGPVFADLTSHRRGTVLDQETEADGQLTRIHAEAPLSLLANYQQVLTSLTGGAGSWSMRPSRYAPLSEVEQRRVLAEQARVHQDD